MSDSPDARTRAVLIEHGLPEGLLPYGLTAADIEDDGRFEVRLPKRVTRKHGGYKVRFGTTISGRLGDGSVRQLKGVDAKQMMWFAVTAIDAAGDQLVFTVGPGVKRELPLADFPPGP